MKGRLHRPNPAERMKLPQIGQIKVGYKDERGYPRSADYFIPTGKYAKLFTDVYGAKPSTIQIIFTDDNPAVVCNERYEYRDKEGKLFAHGDGIIYNVWDGKQYREMAIAEYPNLHAQVAKRSPKPIKDGSDGWDIILTLKFIIPAINNIAGYWSLTTKGVASSIPAIVDTFDQMRETFGQARGIICDLGVSFATSQKPGSKSRYPVITITPNMTKENREILQRDGVLKLTTSTNEPES